MLEVAVAVSLALSILLAVYGFWAFLVETAAEKEVKAAARAVAETGKDAATTAADPEGVVPQGAFTGPSEYLKALAALADSLSKLKRDVAAFVLSMGFLLIAIVGAGVEDKLEDKGDAATESTALARPAP